MLLSLTLTADPGAPARARTAMRAFSLGLAPTVLTDAQLVLSELVSAAVRGGRVREIRVTLELQHDGRVRGEIVAGELPDANDGDRLGRKVVERLATRWGTGPSPTSAWFELGPPGT